MNFSDPRTYQIATLSALLCWGLWGLDHEIRPDIAIAMLIGAQVAQRLASWWVQCRYDPRSALISSLSLVLLLHTSSLLVGLAAACLAIGSKFVLRIRDKHVFNPTNLAIAATLLVVDDAWVSPGQWGSAALGAFALACIGGLVVNRAARSDVTWAFLAAYLTLVFGRAAYLGDPLTLPTHHVRNGGFLIFAFFMISDPKTTPDARAGRILWACLVALAGFYGSFALFHPHALLYALVMLAPLVPIIDTVLPGERYAWASGPRPSGREAAP